MAQSEDLRPDALKKTPRGPQADKKSTADRSGRKSRTYVCLEEMEEIRRSGQEISTFADTRSLYSPARCQTDTRPNPSLFIRTCSEGTASF